MIYYFGGFNGNPGRAAVKKYMMGECAYIALAFHELKGYEIYEVGNHFLTKDSFGNFWDIRGKMTPTQAVDNLTHQGFKPLTPEQVKERLATGLYSDGPFVANRLKVAKKLIRSLTKLA